MSIAHDILPECFVDTNIVNTFLTMEGIYVDANHCHGCNKVGSMMQKLKDEFALGVIDNDKKQHSYNSQFYSLGKTEHLELLKHSSKHHYLIRVSPAMDGFILEVAERQKIDMSDYDLPDKLKDFTEITKDAKAKDSKNLKRLFKDMAGDDEMKILKKILGYIYKNKYDCDEKVVSSFL
ncbi:hypothetical protein [uncultured Bacteroides sp.]|uniref:hypothetical protein n=1 Tax=uncultured Bacteroides sp. TaxID=162156 RepID=UPI0026108F36|nr:hypothetical protein [uncultured Bacteroides sp.]